MGASLLIANLQILLTLLFVAVSIRWLFQQTIRLLMLVARTISNIPARLISYFIRAQKLMQNLHTQSD